MPSETVSEPIAQVRSGPRRSGRIGGVVAAASVIGAVIAVALTAVFAADSFALFGLPDPGALTHYGYPLVRTVAELGAVVCIGSLMLASFGIPAQRSGMLAADGYAAVRHASWAAAVWCVGGALVVPFSAAESTGRPVAEIIRPNALVGMVGALEEPKTWAFSALFAFVVAIGCRVLLSWNWTVVAFGLSLLGLFSVVAGAHSASAGAHDLGTDSLLFHLFAASLWIGGLVALLAHAARNGAHLPLVTRRFSHVATVCWVVLALSGVINAAVGMSLSEVFTTPYGALVLIKVVVLGVLGVLGFFQRRKSLARIATRGRAALLRLGAVELVLMFATVGVAVALGRTPSPAELNPVNDEVELLIGFPVTTPPDFLSLLFNIRFDLVFGTLSIVASALYLWGTRRLRRRGDHWPIGRDIAWVCGWATVLVATSSGIGRYSMAMFSVHMGQHMLLSMLAPVLLVMAGPTSLALRVLTPAGRDEPAGAREWLLAFMHSPITRLLTSPLVALGLFVGSFYALYFSGLFDAALPNHWTHLAMNAHFLLTGYVFYWPVIGIDPAPRSIPSLGKVGLVFASMPFHAFFGIILMMSKTVIGGNFYQSLSLPFVPDLVADQRLGGGLAWAAGEVPLVLVMLALLIQWARADARAARRIDRKADSDGDADLAAYNAMLRELSEQKVSRRPRS